ncbi:MAG: hypothetical protein AAF206_07855 [Bacteroidota bacterium]
MITLMLIALAIGMIRNRRFHLQEARHKKFAKKYDLNLAYMNEKDFTMFGNFRSYPITLCNAEAGNPEAIQGVKIYIPMTNPSRKSIRIVRGDDKHPPLVQFAPFAHALRIPFDVAFSLRAETNDLVFSSLILSDDVRIGIYQLFNKIEAGILYLHDEELACFFPDFFVHNNMANLYHEAMELLADIKDELNQ